jgi:MFS family permease
MPARQSSPATNTSPWRLPPAVAFPVLAVVLFAFFFAASAPSPLFIVMQRDWHFSAAMLTVAFGIYAITLLSALLIAGSLSDHVGRRPVLFGGMAMQTLAMGLFLTADGIGSLLVARIVQGVATGVISGSLTAAVVEAAPEHRKRIGALLSSVSPLAGLAAGALATGVAAKYAAHPVTLVFGVLTVVFAAATVAVAFMPETVTPRGGAWASLKPRVHVAANVRAEFLRAVPVLVTTWAVGGLYLALAATVMVRVFEIDDGVINGATIAVLAGVGAVAPTLLKRFPSATAAALGMGCIAVGLSMLLASIAIRSIGLFFVATAVTGVGFGAAFSAVVQSLATRVAAHDRGELFAAIFITTYLAFSLPAMIAGFLVKPFGLQHTVEGYAALLVVLAVVGGTMQWRGRRQAPAVRRSTS